MKKRISSVLLAVVMVIGLLPTVAVAATTGSWSDSGNYDAAWVDNYENASQLIIEDEEDLAAFIVALNSGKDFAGKTVSLVENTSYDMSAHNWPGCNSTPTAFAGTFDGKDCAVSGITISSTADGTYYCGFIPQASSTALIKNLKLDSVSITTEGANSTYYIGGVVGHAAGTTITNCHVLHGTLTSDLEAMLTGNSQTETKVAKSYMGGILGFGTSSSLANIENCSNHADITNATGVNSEQTRANDHRAAQSYAGGIAGAYATVNLCTNTGNVTATVSSWTGSNNEKNKTYSYCHAGGIIGYTNSEILNCTNSGAVNATNAHTPTQYANFKTNTWAGGIAGFNNTKTTSNSVNTGKVTAKASNSHAATSTTYAGGIVGSGNNGGVFNCDNIGTVSSSATAGTIRVGGVAAVAGVTNSYYYTSTADVATPGTATNCDSFIDANDTVNHDGNEGTAEVSLVAALNAWAEAQNALLDSGKYYSWSATDGNYPALTNTAAMPPVRYTVTLTAGANMTKTDASGAAEQSVSGAITPVVYTANTDYYFPTDYIVDAVNGISVTRDNATQITVSGTPTADTNITLPDATEKEPQSETIPSNSITTTTPESAIASGILSGITADMEYSTSPDFADARTGDGNPISVSSGTYYIRYKATDTTKAGDAITVKVPYYPQIEAPASPSNGNISFDLNTPSVGDTVTVTLTPDYSYAVDTVTATDSDGNPVALTPVSGQPNTYFFVMLDDKVTVTPTFAPVAMTIGGVAVADGNRSGDDWTLTPAVGTKDQPGYVPATLTLNNADLASALSTESGVDLKLVIQNNSTITGGISCGGDLIISGGKDLSVTGSISCTRSLSLSGTGTITVVGAAGEYAIAADSVAVTSGTVIVKSGNAEGSPFAAAPNLTGYSDVQVKAGADEASAQIVTSPDDATYTDSEYVKIEAKPVVDNGDSGNGGSDSGNSSSSSPGSSSSRPSGSSSGTTTKTERNEDGSVTTTTTNWTTGTVTETTRTTDGTTATTVTDKDGNITEVSAQVPASAAGAAEKAGKPVAIPVEVSAAKSSEEALPVKVDVPTNGAAVEIPVENVTPGTVVVIVNADGSETVVSTTALTGNGVVVALEKDATIKVVDNAKAFTDVPATSWAKDAVDFASARSITEGTSETTFSPAAACTRAQMVTFLWRAAGCPEPSSAVCDFTDVNVDSYYGKAVLWAIENGITNGTRDGSTFSPDAECSRAQMAAFLCRMADGKAKSAVNTFADVKDSAYYAEAVQWAVENGITNGTGSNNYSPDATCTRGQMVTFLYRYYVK